MKKIMSFVKSRNKRERIMMLCVLCCILAIWASSMISESADVDVSKIDIDKRLMVAKTAIKMEANIMQRLRNLETEIDKTKTLSPDDLQIAIENIAKQSELEYSISGVETAKLGEFNINKIMLTTVPEDLSKIAKLESLLVELEPYVAIVESSISGDKQGRVSIRYLISSFN